MVSSKQSTEVVLFLTLLVLVVSSAIPKAQDGDKEPHSRTPKDLSDKQHYDEEEHHNSEYDHEAFLGDEYKSFDDLSPEESQKRLAIIYDKIDKDSDGFVTEEELQTWIQHVQNRYIVEDTERQWQDHEITDDALSWDRYKKRTYGFMNDEEDNVIDGTDDGDDDAYNYKDMLRRDERRWKRADGNGDNALDKKEFQDFLHPEDAEHMRDVVIDETIEDIDKDGDGFISLEEYIGDMWPNRDADDEPEWVRTEREQFGAFRDKDGDGRMNRDEVAHWIMPADYDHSAAETRHLMFESDADRDNKLTKDEVLDKFDLFVGSQATDFGEALTRHDEF